MRPTVMVRIRKAAFEQTIAAEFEELHRELTTYFGEMVDHLIANVMKSDGDDETLEQRQIGRQADLALPPPGALPAPAPPRGCRSCRRRGTWGSRAKSRIDRSVRPFSR